MAPFCKFGSKNYLPEILSSLGKHEKLEKKLSFFQLKKEQSNLGIQ